MKRVITRIIPLLVLVAQSAFACSLTNTVLREVSPDLTVVVNHREKPIAGIEVQVVPAQIAGEPVFAGLTDKHGTVLIKGLMVGKYYLTASHRGFEAGKEWIEVVASPNAKTMRRFVFQWADWSYQTRRIAGTLTGLVPGDTGNKIMDLVHPKETVYPGVVITLKSAFANDEYRTLSDSTGSFVIDPVPDGIYILVIAGGMQSIYGTADETSQVIDLKQGTARDSLPMLLKDTGCYRTEFGLLEK